MFARVFPIPKELHHSIQRCGAKDIREPRAKGASSKTSEARFTPVLPSSERPTNAGRDARLSKWHV
jgi:hypothetical protein